MHSVHGNEDLSMTRKFLLTVAACTLPRLAPIAALAMPSVGDIVGTNPKDATAAHEKAGCKVTTFEAEGGKIEAKCNDAATGKVAEVYIDPKSGAVADVKFTD
jgi:hypothetical protein